MNEQTKYKLLAESEVKGMAKAILFMSPMSAYALNMPMTYEEAYEHVFGVPLYDRLTQLIADYGDKHICWELDSYNQGSPANVMMLLGIWRSFKSTMTNKNGEHNENL